METTLSPNVANVALQKLIGDHRRVEDLFAMFEAEDDHELRREIGQKAINALTRHALLEETIVYPIAERVTNEEQLVDDHREEHAVMKSIISDAASLPAGRRFDGKFRALMSVVRNHIEKEEGVLFPLLEKSGVDLKRVLSFGGNGGGKLGVLLLGAAAAAGLYYLAQRPSSHSRP